MVAHRANPPIDHSSSPPSFVTHTSLTSSAAPLFVSFLHQHAQAAPTDIGRLNDDLLVSRSLKVVSGPAALNAVLVAVSIALLMGVVCILGYIYYRKKRCGQEQAIFISNCRPMRIPGKTEDKDDLEASAWALASSADCGYIKDRMSMIINDSKFTCLSIPVRPDSSPPLATPSVGHVRQQSQDLSSISTPSAFCLPEPETFSDCTSMSPRDSESEELEEEDLASVALSSLHSDASCQTIESCVDFLSVSRSILVNEKVSSFEHGPLLGSSHNLAAFDDDDSFLEAVAFSVSPSSLRSSPTSAPDSEFLATTTLALRPYSIASLPSYQSHLALHAEPSTLTKVPPRLLELKLDSEEDLCSWLGLDKENVMRSRVFESEADTSSGRIPELVTTDSQDTVTGTDESSDQKSLQASSEGSYAYEVHQGNQFQMPEDPKQVHHCVESRLPLFKHATAAGGILLHPNIPFTQITTTFVPSDTQFPARTLSPSSSFVSSSTSIITLQLPSFSCTAQKPLVDEVLPPPSIIVSVPTDDSLIPESCGSTQFPIMNIADTQVGLCGHASKKRARNIVKVIYDPLDEVEDEAWDVYERTCFMDTSLHCATGVAAASVGFTESWMASSESSELDIGRAIAKFPLPPIRACSLENTTQ